ncbi:MAG: MFS transporter [Gemmatimonadetes bacterium]|nr:MFS transporter [Gemmatimonadota bacterium]
MSRGETRDERRETTDERRETTGPTPPAPRLPPVVKSLGLVSFFNDFASEMMYPLIPAFVTGLGGGAISLGLLDGISDAVASGAKLWAGWLADRPRWRRPLVVGGYLVAAVARPVIGVASVAWQVIGLRATDRVGKGIRTPPRDAVIADATAPAMRGRAFGFHRAMDHAGAVVGPLVAWGMISLAGLRPGEVIMWSAVPGAVAVLAVFWAMRKEGSGKGEEGRVKRGAGAEGRELMASSVLPDRSRSPSIVFYLIVLFSLVRFPETLLLLRLQDLRLPVALTPIVWAGLHVMRSGWSYAGGRLSDSLGPQRVMVGGWFAYWLVCVGLGTATTAWGAVGWFLLFGVVAALTESPERAFVAAAARRHATGRSFGVYHASVGVAALAGGAVFGTIYATGGGPWALFTSAGAAAVLAVALGFQRNVGADG